MTRGEFFKRYGIWPKHRDDLMRLGSRRRRKRSIIKTLLIGAAVLTLVQERAEAKSGEQSLRYYTEVRNKDPDHHFKIYFLSSVLTLTSGTSLTRDTSLPGWSGAGGDTIECYGGGGTGAAGFTCSCINIGGGGGGGGGYAKSTNPGALPATVNFAVGGAGGATNFNGAHNANGGGNGSTSSPGGGGAGTGGTTLNRTGGTGGTGNGTGGGGGGGCAGPTSNGGTGGNGGSGGGGGGTAGGGGGGQAGAGGTGGVTTGSVGGGGNLSGGAGGGGSNGNAGGAGVRGIIVVTWTPFFFFGGAQPETSVYLSGQRQTRVVSY